MKLTKKVIAFTLIILTLVTPVFITSAQLVPDNKDGAFYVGVTFCGNTTEEAKHLIDKVKDYTNLFVLQSGPLQNDSKAIDEIGDYAVGSGLSFIVYFGSNSAWLMKTWLDTYHGQWGSSFLGIYFNDEPGGKMLDAEMTLYDQNTQSSMRKMADGRITGYKMDENTTVTYQRDGTIIVNVTPNIKTSPTDDSPISYSTITYYTNGTTIMEYYPDLGSMPTVTHNPTDLAYSYTELWQVRPFQTADEAAERFVDETNYEMHLLPMDPHSKVKSFTSDYALYWFDYKAGYDVVLAQLGWNQSVSQNIALVRGAANLQGKEWGTVITWKYTQQPYLANGDEIYQQMCQSYENGAAYVLVFNYAEDMQGAYGTLQEEHFQALERFWKNEVKNASVIHGAVKADTAFVLPENFGSGLRSQQDILWGLWSPNDFDTQVFTQLQAALSEHGEKLDIVYSDPAYTTDGKYSEVINLYTDPPSSTTNWLLIITSVVLVATVSVIAVSVFLRKNRNLRRS